MTAPKVLTYTLAYGPGINWVPPPRIARGAEGFLPRLHDEVLNCVVYLYRSFHEAKEAINIGGSGFLVAMLCENVPPPAAHIYAVTNKHVVSGALRVFA
jgi:hypothetical protein